MTEKQVPYELHDLTKDPLSVAQLKKLLKAAGLSAREAVRTNEDAYKEFVAGKNLSDGELLAILAEHPELIQRPLVVRGEKVVLARPAENLKKLGI